MFEYVVIEGDTYPVNTEAEIKAAARALSEAGINSAEVWVSPKDSAESIDNDGDPDAVKNGQILFADSNVDPVENGTAPSLGTILETIGVKSLAIFVAYRMKSPENDWPHYEWIVELTRDGYTLRTPYKQGVGLGKPLPKAYRLDRPDSVREQLWYHEVKSRSVPTAADVVSTLIASSSGSDQTFQDWCSDFGHSEDSRQALDTYLTCQRELVGLRRLLGQHFNAACEAARDL